MNHPPSTGHGWRQSLRSVLRRRCRAVRSPTSEGWRRRLRPPSLPRPSGVGWPGASARCAALTGDRRQGGGHRARQDQPVRHVPEISRKESESRARLHARDVMQRACIRLESEERPSKLRPARRTVEVTTSRGAARGDRVAIALSRFARPAEPPRNMRSVETHWKWCMSHDEGVSRVGVVRLSIL